MRLVTNKILIESKKKNRNETNTDNHTNKLILPSKMCRKNYGPVTIQGDLAVNNVVECINKCLDQKLLQKEKKNRKNLSKDEISGLEWLQKMINEDKLAVVQADKGGAILLVYPDLLKTLVKRKLNDPEIYNKLSKNPTKELHNELFQLWVKGKEKTFITADEAKDIMGVSNNQKSNGNGPTNRPSTLPHYKPGKAYFYPSLKIHKLKKEELIPGVEVPIRLITALQEGISKRSDVFLAQKFLNELEKDFCLDLLKDTNEALQWYDYVDKNNPSEEKMTYKSFTFDFKALYDSLKPDLVKKAIIEAMKEKRPNWSKNFKDWIIELIVFSLKAAIGEYDGEWFSPKNGIPTGGSLCVPLANITVYYVMRKEVYSNMNIMHPIKSVKRYIDDGAGFYTGLLSQYRVWIDRVNDLLKPYGLIIDEFQVEDVGNYVNFLDTKFCFDRTGTLQTDLYVKETDARSYLNFASCHPNHIYSGIVYSQCNRVRRIVNNKDRLKTRLDELKNAFICAGYPEQMVKNISNKVLNSERNIFPEIIETEPVSSENIPKINVISTFGCDEDIVSTLKRYEPELKNTNTFKKAKGIFKFVKKTAGSLRNKIVRNKTLALGKRFGLTKPCKGKTCKCCKILCKKQSMKINGKIVKCAPGTCHSYNIIYAVKCKLCQKNGGYFGRSTRQLNVRIREHRSAFYKLIAGENIEFTKDDDFSLGIHLYFDHGFCTRNMFDKTYEISIVENVSPYNMETVEHKYIHKYRTLRPNGINTQNPFGIPLLQ